MLTKWSPSAAISITGLKHFAALSMGVTVRISKPAVFNTLERTNCNAMRTRKPGAKRPCLRPSSTISSARVTKLEKAESSTMAATEGSRSAYSKAVAAPILRPHKAMLDVVPPARRKSITH